MGYLGPDGLKHMGLAVRPEFHKALKRFAADSQLTTTHVIIDAVARRLERAGYWPVLTAGAKERRKRRRIKRMVEADSDNEERRARAEPGLDQTEGRASGGPPTRIGTRGRSIG